MIGLYFSGTGNTKYAMETLVSYYDPNANLLPIEQAHKNIAEIESQEMIILAYPIYYSNLPKIVYDFIVQNANLWKNKKVFILCTMGLFSGDGSGVSARLLKTYGADILGGLHIKMPDCICDEKLLKYPASKNKEIIKKATLKLEMAANTMKKESYPKEGLNFLYHMAGLFGQRLWFYNKTKKYSTKLKIDIIACIQCEKCVSLCPMKNLHMEEGNIQQIDRCTMCYRCINECPQKAITLLGKQVYVQHQTSTYKTVD